MATAGAAGWAATPPAFMKAVVCGRTCVRSSSDGTKRRIKEPALILNDSPPLLWQRDNTSVFSRRSFDIYEQPLVDIHERLPPLCLLIQTHPEPKFVLLHVCFCWDVSPDICSTAAC